MIESWIVGIVFVGAIVLAVLRVGQRIIRSDERRDARRRNRL